MSTNQDVLARHAQKMQSVFATHYGTNGIYQWQREAPEHSELWRLARDFAMGFLDAKPTTDEIRVLASGQVPAGLAERLSERDSEKLQGWQEMAFSRLWR